MTDSLTSKKSQVKKSQLKTIKEPMVKMVNALEELSNGFTKHGMVAFVECIEGCLTEMLSGIESIEKSAE